MSSASALLEVDYIGKSFGRRTVLKGASFHARPGTVTALMGRNGAGKSTLMRIAIGRVRPDYGRIAYRGRLIERPSLARLARSGLMYCAQNDALTSLHTVGEHLAAVADAFGGGERLAPIIDELRLGGMLGRRPGQISGGERQRAVLGMALIRAPECLLIDEPFAGVAPLDRPLITSGIRRLREAGAAIVVSGHDIEDLFAVSDEIIWVTAGTTHWLESPDAAMVHDQFRREYLGPRRLGRS